MPHKRKKFSDRQAERDFRGTDHAPSTAFDIGKEPLPKGKMNILNAGNIRAAFRERKLQEKQKGKGKAPSELTSKDVKGKGKAREEDAETDPTQLRIRPGEKMGEFNARVEQAFAPTISAAARHASKHSQNQKKRKRAGKSGDAADEDEDGEYDEAGREKRKTNAIEAKARERRENDALRAQREAIAANGKEEDRDFATASQKRSVRDVVDAPPTLKAGKFSKASAGTKADRLGQRIMEESSDAANAKRAQKRLLEEERERVIGIYRQKKEAALKAKLGA